MMASSTEGSSGKESKKQAVVNSFANDGSFFEMYQQKLKEMENTKNKEEEDINEEKRKTTNLLLQGKRKIPVGRMGGSSKQLDAKKKKIEKEKTQDKLTGNPDEKSPAWKAYMEEVQKYKEMSCSDDSDNIRPLVK